MEKENSIKFIISSIDVLRGIIPQKNSSKKKSSKMDSEKRRTTFSQLRVG
jgi:hypothetical protein